MTTIIDGSAGITFPAGGNPQAAPAGVIQVVTGSNNTYTSTNSTTLISTGLTASITPKFSTSKILVIASVLGLNASATNNNPHLELFRNGSSVSYWDDIIGNGTTNGGFCTSLNYLDSPASTSSTTYTVYWKRVGPGSGSAIINNYEVTAGQTVSTITLLEIAQ